MIYRTKQKLDMGPAPIQPVFDEARSPLGAECQASFTKRVGFASSDQHTQRTVWPELYVFRSCKVLISIFLLAPHLPTQITDNARQRLKSNRAIGTASLILGP